MVTGTWTTVNPCAATRADFAGWGTTRDLMGITRGSTDATTEEYDGTSWGSGGNITVARWGGGGTGSLTDAIACGGWNLASTDEYNGTTWSSGADMGAIRFRHCGAGASQTDAIVYTNHQGTTGQTEEYNGTSWNYTAALIADRSSPGGGGLTSDAIFVTGGLKGSNGNEQDDCYLFDGTVWSTTALYPFNNRSLLATGSSIGIVAAGGRAEIGWGTTRTYEFNSISWAQESDLNQGRQYSNKAGGNHQDAIIVAGEYGGVSTEEWDDDIPLCWNYTARYFGSGRLFKLSGDGPFPKYLGVPSNVNKSTGRMIDDGIEIDPDEYEIL